MSQSVALVALFLLIVPLLTWALHRDIRRAVRRRETATRWARMGGAFRAAGVATGAGLAPAFGKAIRAAADMERALAQVNAAYGQNVADLARLATESAQREHDVKIAPLTWAMREWAKEQHP